MANELSQILNQVKAAQGTAVSEQKLNEMSQAISELNDKSVSQFNILNQMAFTAISNLENSIPGKEALIAAFSAGNPLVAGGIQLMRDMAAQRREAKKKAQAAYDEQVQVIQEEFKKVVPEEKAEPRSQNNEQQKLVPDERQPMEQPNVTVENIVPEAPEQVVQDNTDIVQGLSPLDKLEPIREQIDDLNGIAYAQLKVLGDLYQEWSGTPSKMIEILDEQLMEQERLRKDNEQRAADETLRGAEEPPKLPTPSDGSGVSETVKDEWSPIQAVIMGMGGLSSAAGAMLKPLSKVLKIFRVGPLALISAAWDFGKGFMNAGEILDKENVGISDRIVAGASEILGGFADVVDFGAGLLGYDTNFGQTIRESYLEIMETPLKYANMVEEQISKIFDGIDGSTKLSAIPGIIWDNIVGMYHGAMAKITSYDLIGKAKDKLTELSTSVTDSVTGFVEDIETSITDYIKGISETTSEFFTNLWDTSLDKMINMIKDVPLVGEDMSKKLESMKVKNQVDSETLDPVKVEAARRKLTEARERTDRFQAIVAEQQNEETRKQMAQVLNMTTVNNNKSMTTVVKGGKQDAFNPSRRDLGFDW
ncbi:tail length tape measure protein [Vibrio phage VP-1]|uniref:Tail length tape measure protein n=1 Tax=Vibrio phage VP-1 TaxID=2234088 RepID=A0A4P2THB7_9CAUD|nr:tail length tape measure protein [Vibrio phage VP-1]